MERTSISLDSMNKKVKGRNFVELWKKEAIKILINSYKMFIPFSEPAAV